MARKTDDLLADLDQLGLEEQSGAPTTAPPPPSQSNKPTAAAAKQALAPNTAKTPLTQQPSTEEDEDPLADLQAQLAARPQAGSRPATPRLSSSTTSGGATKSPGKKQEYTPASSGPPSGRTSEDRLRGVVAATGGRASAEPGRSYHQGVTPAEEEPRESKPAAEVSEGGGGGWWGSMFSAATAAVKQAESLAKEIRGNEEAQRWAEQVRGNISHLQHFGTDLRTKALPTFTSLLSHIAPPISAHERLQIHTTHDIHHYPSLDPLIYATFARIMAQVEGGDLLVIQRGSENRSRSRTASEPQGYRGGSVIGAGGNGWTDGPWWRDEHVKRDLGAVAGLKEGTRLARVSAEAYAKEFFEARGGVEEAAKKATEMLSETNPVRSSDIFLAIQAVSYRAERELFAEGAGREEEGGVGGVVEGEEEQEEELVCFAVYLHDPIHSLSFSGLSQPFPQRWAAWLDASVEEGDEEGLPESITEIIAGGGVDPREWVAEWMEEVLSLAVGVVAQRYVARRMGVGEGGLGRGKRRAEEEGIGGEAARAI